MRMLFSLLLISALCSGADAGGKLTGKWSGSFDITTPSGETKADTAYMELKEEHGQVTGTAGPNVEKQWPLQGGKLAGEKLTFEVRNEEGSLLVFDLRFDGEQVTGTCAGTNDDGEKMSAKLNLKRTPD